MSETAANFVWALASLLALAGVYVIAARRGYWRGYKAGRTIAVAEAEIGIDDGLDRTELPRPDCPPAVVREADMSRSRFLPLQEWEEPW